MEESDYLLRENDKLRKKIENIEKDQTALYDLIGMLKVWSNDQIMMRVMQAWILWNKNSKIIKAQTKKCPAARRNIS